METQNISHNISRNLCIFKTEIETVSLPVTAVLVRTKQAIYINKQNTNLYC